MRLMLRLVLTFLLLLLPGLWSALATQSDGAAPRPLAVWFYADWCTNCKLIAPKLERVLPAYAARIDFIKIDLTQDWEKTRFRDEATRRGFAELYRENRRTGWVALLDPHGRQVGELKQEMPLAEMRQRLAAHAGG